MNNSKVITGKQLKDMLLGAYHSFEKNFEAINDLNVFPVPDGDTGILLVTDNASLLDLIISDLVTGDIGVYTKNNVEKDNREDYHPYIELKWSSVFSCRFYLLFNGHCELWIKARSLHPS